MTIETLKRDLRQFRTLSLSIYDGLEAGQTVRDQLAFNVDNRTARDNPVRLDEDFFFPEVFGWEDEPITIDNLDRIEFVVPMKGYSGVLPYNEVNLGRPNTVARLERLVPRLPDALLRKQTQLIMEVFRRNPTCYTGQPFFNNAHPHPGQDNGTFNNTIGLGFAHPALPTTDEIKALLHDVNGRFTDNLTIQAEVIDAEMLDKNLLVIVHNVTHYNQFNKVRRMPKIDNKENEHFGSFRLLRDVKPTVGQENYIEFVLTGVGPKTSFLIIDTNPMLDAQNRAELSNRVPEGYVGIVFKQQFAVKPGYPQPAIQGQG